VVKLEIRLIIGAENRKGVPAAIYPQRRIQMPVIFISHSSADKPVIDDFFDLLQTGCDLRREDIFCSSVEGAGIKTGADFIRWIQDHLNTSSLIILFLTPSYNASKFCLAEMGAAWGIGKDVFPLVVPTIERDAGSVMVGKQTAIVNETGLDDLRDVIAKHYPAAAKATARWSLKKEQFIAEFKVKLNSLSAPQLVDYSQVDNERKRTVAAMELNSQLTKEKKLLLEHIGELEKAKDAKDVATINSKFMPKNERYEELVQDVHKWLSDLTIVEVRCIYAYVIEGIWQPSKDDSKYYASAIKRAIMSNSVEEKQDYNFESGFVANSDHPKLRPVFQAIESLQSFIENELSTKELEKLEEKHKLYVKVNNIEYWEKVLYGNYLPA
jgi:hypothetical protein